jgi:hypothetical protein
MNQRFTIDGSDALEERLAWLCQEAGRRVASVIPEGILHAIVLGGGYGRGEGGVLQTSSGDEPYNDLEFFVLLRGLDLINQRRFGARIHEVGSEMTREAGLDVEFKLLGIRKLRDAPVSMFYYDLISGHRLVRGPEDWLNGCDQHRAAHRIPLHEATRLLMNRCSGLLFAQERLLREPFTPDDADFTGRNLAKAKLAFGDAALVTRGQYHWSCRERHKRLRKLDAEGVLQNLSSLLPLHEQGVSFKLHPVSTERSREELQYELNFLKELGRELWLDVESRRLGKRFTTLEQYCAEAGSLCPETRNLRNRLINFRTFGPRGLACARYPRERLFRSLPVLLWSDFKQRERLSLAQSQLRSGSATLPALVRAYESLWRIYN